MKVTINLSEEQIQKIENLTNSKIISIDKETHNKEIDEYELENALEIILSTI